jgi:hypothetical protein
VIEQSRYTRCALSPLHRRGFHNGA